MLSNNAVRYMVTIPEHYIEVKIVSRSGHELPEGQVEEILKKYVEKINREISVLSDGSAP